MVHIDAVSWGFWAPHLAHGNALEDGDEDARCAEGEGEEVHGVDAEARVVVDC